MLGSVNLLVLKGMSQYVGQHLVPGKGCGLQPFVSFFSNWFLSSHCNSIITQVKFQKIRGKKGKKLYFFRSTRSVTRSLHSTMFYKPVEYPELDTNSSREATGGNYFLFIILISNRFKFLQDKGYNLGVLGAVHI